MSKELYVTHKLKNTATLSYMIILPYVIIDYLVEKHTNL